MTEQTCTKPTKFQESLRLFGTAKDHAVLPWIDRVVSFDVDGDEVTVMEGFVGKDDEGSPWSDTGEGWVLDRKAARAKYQTYKDQGYIHWLDGLF